MMTDKQVDDEIKAIKKLHDFEKNHKIYDSVAHLTEAQFDQWLKLLQ